MFGNLTSIELCAGGGGQALGVEKAGFQHLAVVELNKHAAQTLRDNRPEWNVVEEDLKTWSASDFKGVDLLAAGLPCPPFSKAGKQLGDQDERNLFPAAFRIIKECRPSAIMIENVRGLLDAVFLDFRSQFQKQLKRIGYESDWKLFNASDFGVPQLRPRVVFVAMKKDLFPHFEWPEPTVTKRTTVGKSLYPLMSSCGWKGAKEWAKNADEIAPTLVGGSFKHGGPDLGPTRAKRAWAELGVNAISLANEPPPPDYVGMPRLTVEMCAVLQGFPTSWKFSGKKTNAYRQVGNAFPPPVAEAVALKIKEAFASSAQLQLAI